MSIVSAVKTICSVIIFIGAGFSGAALAAQQTPAPASKAAKVTNPWQVNCSTAGGITLTCQMSQSIFLAKTRQRILTALISQRPGTNRLVLHVVLPLGIFFPKGVTVTIDNKSPKTYVIETADKNGSYATIPLNKVLLARLRAGKILAFAVQNLKSKTIKIELPLKGFTASEAALESSH